ncbi:SMP-30/gluconolactonase/LRE family protein [Streptomyces sp. S465]|uniref:SMP-30/gluconolactonase/LRE family protein n=1 Tax=Streptomyces sp. S465 TaxID=2979468 RepID=UPI0022A839D8|nr:SMP-30/gluconolactonase/LRE family protein [Streptomyces sp. S465]WAP55014.1 SMP-30/gluconolactonase/LRE family protein [Streptomyces sp. S465]
MKTYASGMRWGEAPRWHEGALWLSDTQASRLWTDASGSWRPFDLDSPSNGLWFLPDGRLVGAMMYEARIAQWDGQRWQPYADLAHLGVGPLGDMVGDADGNLYVDDVAFDAASGAPAKPGRIILVRPDGSATVAADGVDFPNGLAMTDGGRTLVVAQTALQCLTAFTVRADHTLSAPRRYADLRRLVGPDARPDGIWPTEHGIWVATTSGQALVRVTDDRLHHTVDTAPRLPIACCRRGDGTLIATLADTHGAPLMDAVASRTVTASAVLITTPGTALPTRSIAPTHTQG